MSDDDLHIRVTAESVVEIPRDELLLLTNSMALPMEPPMPGAFLRLTVVRMDDLPDDDSPSPTRTLWFALDDAQVAGVIAQLTYAARRSGLGWSQLEGMIEQAARLLKGQGRGQQPT